MTVLNIVINHQFDLRLVLLAFLIGGLTSYLFLTLSVNLIKRGSGWGVMPLLLGAIVTGSGFWLSAFLCIMATQSSYDFSVLARPWLLLSWGITLLSFGFALYQAQRQSQLMSATMINGITVGLGMGLMFYVNIEALQPTSTIEYDIPSFFLSLLMSIASGITALWISAEIGLERKMTVWELQPRFISGALGIATLVLLTDFLSLNTLKLSQKPPSLSTIANNLILTEPSLNTAVILSILGLFLAIIVIALLDAYRPVQFEPDELAYEANFGLAHLPGQRSAAMLSSGSPLHEKGKVNLAALVDKESLSTEVVSQIKSRFNYSRVLFYLANEKGDSFFLAGAKTDSNKMLTETQFSIPNGVTLVGQAAAMGIGLLIKDVREDPTWVKDGFFPPTRSEIAVPIVINNKTKAVIHIKELDPNTLTRDDIKELETISADVGAALQQSDLFEEAIEARSTAFWAEAADAMSTKIEAADILLVEERPNAEAIGRNICTQLGFKVNAVEATRDIPQLYAPLCYRLILIPLSLTALNPLELVAQIRTVEKELGTGRSTIIGLAPNAYDIIPKIDPAHGFNGFLRKPLRRYEVADLLNAVLSDEVLENQPVLGD